MPISIGYHIWGVLTSTMLPIMWPTSKGYKNDKLGELRIYGPPGFVDECLKAVNVELPKYDPDLKARILRGEIKLTFSHQKTQYMSAQTAGLYMIPKRIWQHGVEGICQYIVYAHIQSEISGHGLWQAIQKRSIRKDLISLSKDKMKQWLQKVNYPSGWIECYKQE